MSKAPRSPAVARDDGGPRAPGRRVATAVCAVVLLLGHVVTGYAVLLAVLLEPAGPWDRDAVTGAVAASWVALFLCAVTALMTWGCVKARWLRRWWFVLPAALAAVALLRLTVFRPEL